MRSEMKSYHGKQRLHGAADAANLTVIGDCMDRCHLCGVTHVKHDEMSKIAAS